MGVRYPVWLDRLTHLLREAQSHWPPFCFHSQLCKNDTRAAYQKTRMPWNWDEYFKCLRKLSHFQQALTFDRIITITFKNGDHCVRALRCHQGRRPLQLTLIYSPEKKTWYISQFSYTRLVILIPWKIHELYINFVSSRFVQMVSSTFLFFFKSRGYQAEIVFVHRFIFLNVSIIYHNLLM